MSRDSSEDFAGLLPLAPAAAFAAATALWIRKVGVEPMNGRVAVAAAAFLHGGRLPLAFNYKGGPGVYILLAPFVAAFGASMRALRASSVFWSGAFVAATGLLAQRASGSRRAGLFAAALAAATPGLSFFTPWGQFGGVAETALAAAGLAELIACARRRGVIHARMAGLLLGLALATKTVVAGLVAGLLAWAILNRKKLGSDERRLIAQGAIFFLLPLVPYLWALSAGGLWRNWWNGPVLGGRAGPPAVAYSGGLLLRMKQFAYLLAGNTEVKSPFVLAGVALAAGLIAASLRRFLLAPSERTRSAAFLWTLLACFLLLSPFTPSILRPLHLLTAVPVLWAAAAASLSWGGTQVERRLYALLAAAYLGTAGTWTALACRYQARTGDAGGETDVAFVDMARYFAARPELTPVVCGDLTGSELLRLLTGREPARLGIETTGAAETPAWRQALGDPSSVFVVAAAEPVETVYARAKSLGCPLVEVGVLRDRLGAPAHYLLARARRAQSPG